MRELLGRHSDIALAGLVVLIVGMMIVPLPTFVLDVLISLNIAVSVTLLLITIYVSDALKIATFPTLLLITTLFRLSLEVSATRLILLNADAGEVIEAFGNFVVAGNLVVGAVIFLILTVIQFVVISKGAERVAEVGARFTLDAMPGKQMSIDAELRSGHIDHNEARRRRALLTRESQFFGSMDGAMKFVKGDAIAGVVVLVVNIVGGLVIGIWQRGMDAATAAHTFTVLTIGEGLVAQIPALIVSTAAGMLVTRVSSEDEGAHLGREIGGQVLAQPKALAVAAALLVGLAAIPGLPTGPFLLLAAVLGFVAFKLMRAPVKKAAQADAAGPPRPGPQPEAVSLAPPVLVALGSELTALVSPRGDGGRLMTELVPQVRDRFFTETGIPVPVVRVQGHAADVAPLGFSVKVNDVPVAVDIVERGGRLAPEEVIAGRLLAALRRHGHELVGIQEAQHLLEALERTHPALVREVVPKLVSPVLLADILRRLAVEGVSLRHLREILGALAEWAPVERDAVPLTEHVRAALRRQLTFKHAPSGTLPVFLLDAMIEDTVREAIQRTNTGSYLALEPALARDIVSAVRAATMSAETPVVLTGADIRRYVKRLVEAELPAVSVLSFQELSPEVKLQPLARISVT